MVGTALSDLAPELLDRVVEELWHSSRAELSLCSKLFRRTAAPRLFASVRFWNEYGGSQDPDLNKRKAAFFVKHPQLWQHVQRVMIDIDEVRVPDPFLVEKFGPDYDDEFDTGPDLGVKPADWIKLLSTMRATKLTFTMARKKERSSLQAALKKKLPRFTTVTHIELWSGDSHFILPYCPSLQRLVIHGGNHMDGTFDISEKHALAAIKATKACPLSHLTMHVKADGMWGGLLPAGDAEIQLLDALANAPSARTLVHVSFIVAGAESGNGTTKTPADATALVHCVCKFLPRFASLRRLRLRCISFATWDKRNGDEDPDVPTRAAILALAKASPTLEFVHFAGDYFGRRGTLSSSRIKRSGDGSVAVEAIPRRGYRSESEDEAETDP